MKKNPKLIWKGSDNENYNFFSDQILRIWLVLILGMQSWLYECCINSKPQFSFPLAKILHTLSLY